MSAPTGSTAIKNRTPKAFITLPPGGKALVRVIGDFVQPNGLIGTPDGKTLYVADIGDSKTYSYAIAPDGSLINKHLFCQLGSDGMTLDSEGNVYLTGHGVTVFDHTGTEILHLPIPKTGPATSASAARTATPCSSPPATASTPSKCASTASAVSN